MKIKIKNRIIISLFITVGLTIGLLAGCGSNESVLLSDGKYELQDTDNELLGYCFIITENTLEAHFDYIPELDKGRIYIKYTYEIKDNEIILNSPATVPPEKIFSFEFEKANDDSLLIDGVKYTKKN